MLKLYKVIDRTCKYWETWNKNKKTGIIHWGEVGDHGQNPEIKSSLLHNFKRKMQRLAHEKDREGYVEIEASSKWTIEFKVEKHGTVADVGKRHKVQGKINELSGWTGLGDCGGSSVGNGTMEICTNVVDFEIAKRVIEKNIIGTEFQTYTSIYSEN